MNPRTNYDEADTATARAFVHLFIRHNDQFEFGVDSTTDDNKELRAHLSVTDHRNADGQSTIGLTGLNCSDKFEHLADEIRTMGLTVVEESEEECEDETMGGTYTANTLTAYADDEQDGVPDAAWNTPCLVVYGSLTPELEEACQEAFGTQFDYHNIRNHYVIVGGGLSPTHRTTLSETVSGASYIFDEEKRDMTSSITTSEFV